MRDFYISDEGDSGPPISDGAFREVGANTLAFGLASDRFMSLVQLMKDITWEEFNTEVTGVTF